MFNQRTMLRYVLLCLLFFLPIQATSAALNQPLMALGAQRGDEVATIAIEHQDYQKTLSLVKWYTRQHTPCFIVDDLEKIITDYCYEKPKLPPQLMPNWRHKCCVCITVSFCTSLVVGITVICSTLYPGVSLNSHGGYR